MRPPRNRNPLNRDFFAFRQHQFTILSETNFNESTIIDIVGDALRDQNNLDITFLRNLGSNIYNRFADKRILYVNIEAWERRFHSHLWTTLTDFSTLLNEENRRLEDVYFKDNSEWLDRNTGFDSNNELNSQTDVNFIGNEAKDSNTRLSRDIGVEFDENQVTRFQSNTQVETNDTNTSTFIDNPQVPNSPNFGLATNVTNDVGRTTSTTDVNSTNNRDTGSTTDTTQIDNTDYTHNIDNVSDTSTTHHANTDFVSNEDVVQTITRDRYDAQSRVATALQMYATRHINNIMEILEELFLNYSIDVDYE